MKEKKQTAIQELVEIFEEMRSPFYNGSSIDVALAISLMKSMLEKEKKMMEMVYIDSFIHCSFRKNSDFEKYYNATFNTEQTTLL